MVGRTGNYENSLESENFPRVDYDGSADVSYFDATYNAGKLYAFISMFNVNNIVTNIEGEKLEDNNLVIYPNPAYQLINVFVNNKNAENLELIIYNNVGQIVYVQPNIKEGNDNLDINTLADGYYMVLIKEKNLVVAKGRFIKE